MHLSAEADFLAWVRNDYAEALMAFPDMGSPTLARLLIQPDPETVSYCFQMTAPDREAAIAWHESPEASRLRDELSVRFGERLVHFTTYMETLPLQ